MLSRPIRQRDRLVTLVRAGKFGQCPLCRSVLRTGYFREQLLFADQGLHFLDERWRAEVGQQESQRGMHAGTTRRRTDQHVDAPRRAQTELQAAGLASAPVRVVGRLPPKAFSNRR